MKPIEFKEMTTATNQKIDPEIQKKEMRKYPHLDRLRILPSMVTRDYFVTCWKLSFCEKISALFFGKIWLIVHAAIGEHPPIGVQCCNHFKTKKGGGSE